MEKSRELVWPFLLQQEGQPDMGAEVNPVDGMDAQHWQTGRSLLALGHHHRPARLHYRGPERLLRKIGGNRNTVTGRINAAIRVKL